MAPLITDAFSDRRWHTLSREETLRELACNEFGLSEDEVAERRKIFGPNKLPEGRRPGVIAVFIRQFKNPIIYFLLAAGVVSLGIRLWSDATFIFGVLLINSIIGTIQEWKAENSAESLKSLLRIVAVVRRAGSRRKVDSIDLVPGDVVELESGDAVPADIRLLSAQDLRVDESLLTGESIPVRKEAKAILADDTFIGDRLNTLYAGTAVMDGRAIGVVCHIGTGTEVGHIAESLEEAPEVPPLIVRLNQFTRTIAVVVLSLIFLFGLAQYFRGGDLVHTFILAVALAVSSIPEGLPVAITVALAVATNRMARRNVIVRLLPAVEGLGACTLVASDKTGTLTVNSLTIKCVQFPDGEFIDVEGEGLDPRGRISEAEKILDEESERRTIRLAAVGALCNEAGYRVEDGSIHHIGNPDDLAFLVFAAKTRLDQTQEQLREKYPQIGFIPFESERRFTASFNRHRGRVMAHVKGAAETVLPMCEGVDAEAIERQVNALANDGYRVLAVASGEADERRATQNGEDALRGLEFLALVGLMDPLRPQVPEAMARCASAGVQVRMITGDHPVTGLAIARRLGIAERESDVMTGSALSALQDDEAALSERIANSRVFARIEPAQKTIIVNNLQRAGHFVAVTGDGVNDAPALRSSHLGVAMGRSGTDVAREAADLILTDDNFASIVNGIEEGRTAYDNVRKVTYLLISTGASEIVLFFLALSFGLPLPLDAVQLLWLNLVTNGIQDVALAFEKSEPGVLDKPPRPPTEPIFNRLMIEENVLSGAFIGFVAFGLFYWLLSTGTDEFSARNILLLLMVLFENVHIFNCRSETRSAFRVPLRSNPFLIIAVIMAQSVHIVSMYTPGLSYVLEAQPVDVRTWLLLLALALSVVAVMEVYKIFRANNAVSDSRN